MSGWSPGACLAEMGNHVVCVDNDADKIHGLQRGVLPIYEPGLESFVHDNAAMERLQFSTDIEHGIDHGEVLFIAVGTPPRPDGSADLQQVLAVAEAIGARIAANNDSGNDSGNDSAIDRYRVVVTKSTVPVGTTEKVRAVIAKAIKKRGLAISFGMVSNPEFLKQGAAVDDFMKPDRIIIGATEPRALDIMRKLYAPFNRNRERVISMDIASRRVNQIRRQRHARDKNFLHERDVQSGRAVGRRH